MKIKTQRLKEETHLQSRPKQSHIIQQPIKIQRVFLSAHYTKKVSSPQIILKQENLK